eukprot:807974-Amphidinium_carterae.1
MRSNPMNVFFAAMYAFQHPYSVGRGLPGVLCKKSSGGAACAAVFMCRCPLGGWYTVVDKVTEPDSKKIVMSTRVLGISRLDLEVRNQRQWASA